jgi:hypothetical protein
MFKRRDMGFVITLTAFAALSLAYLYISTGMQLDNANGSTLSRLLRPDSPWPKGTQEKWKLYLSQENFSADITWDKLSGLPLTVKGILTKSDRRPITAVAANFFSSYGELFGNHFDFGNFRLSNQWQTPRIKHLIYTQQFDGYPLLHKALALHFDSKNRIRAIEVNYEPEITVDNIETISPTEAIAIAQRYLSTSSSVKEWNLVGPLPLPIVLVPQHQIYRRAFAIPLFSAAPLASEIALVDTESGDILLHQNLLLARNPIGEVYDTNPDQGRLIEVELPDLIANGEILRGKFGSIQNFDRTEQAQPAPHYRYAPGTDLFDQIMAYHHLSRINTYFQENLHYPSLQKPIRAVVNFCGLLNSQDTLRQSANDNAFFVAAQNQYPDEYLLIFGEGSNLRDATSEAAMIYHEYIHVSTYEITGWQFQTHPENLALAEGYADYFAASLSGQPRLLGYIAQMKPALWRDLSIPKMYPDDFSNEPHQGGQIFGYAAWKLRELLGKDVANNLIHESRFFLPASKSNGFSAAFAGILAADQILFDKRHHQTILKVMSDTGFNQPE